MHLPAPNLDDRRFQDLVDEAKRQIPRFCPNWTDHNVSDPGITLIELFAWMTEQYIFRLNQVPNKNMLVFLDLIGARLQPAQPAKGDITFTLSAAPTAERRAIIPKWTEVATERTEMQEAVVFTTDLEAEVIPPIPCWFLTSADGEDYKDRSAVFTEISPTDLWGTPPHAPQAFYIGFSQDTQRAHSGHPFPM